MSIDERVVPRYHGILPEEIAEKLKKAELTIEHASQEHAKKQAEKEIQKLSQSIQKDGRVNDLVNHPPHYTFGKFEVLDVLMDWFASAPLLWQVVKYVARAQHKGSYLQDLRKAEFYLKKAIEIAENEAANLKQ